MGSSNWHGLPLAFTGLSVVRVFGTKSGLI
jgi:hypothetical protein